MDIDKELNELLVRFRRLKKAIAEEDAIAAAQRATREFARTRLNKSAIEQKQAQALADLLQKRGLLGAYTPRQPTDQELFGHLVKSKEEINQIEQNWNNGISNWMAEVTKPISSRFKSPEEEEAYWNNIKITDSNHGTEGY